MDVLLVETIVYLTEEIDGKIELDEENERVKIQSPKTLQVRFIGNLSFHENSLFRRKVIIN